MENVVAMNTKSLPGLKFNPDITVSIGNSRWSKDWKRRSWKWSALLARFAPENATRTPETQTEFFNMSKNEQDKIKDIGGFVGGEIQGSRRQAVNMKSRSLLTFDMDEAPTGFAETMRETYPDIAWAIYSTHKHTPEKPRLRLIIPLDHKVTPDEFEAVMRKMAQDIGMSYMDKSTFEPHRLMYWPSSSIDAEYVFEYNDAAPLDPDTILESYEGDWHDCSLWPIHPGEEKEKREKNGAKQQNPTEKRGLIGVFCRTYTVPEAIAAFLPDVYKPVDNMPDRYTYVEGSTSGGLVIYDDGLFCYSHHATDPASGMELNAYDLVRIHKFGSLDEEAAENTPANRLPSAKAMGDLIRGDEKCLITYDTEQDAQTASDYGDLDDTVEGQDPEDGEKKEKNWKVKLERNKDGSIAAKYLNVEQILIKDKKLSGIAYNELARAIVCKKALPWDKEAKGREWRDADDSALYGYLTNVYHCEFKKMHAADALVNVAHMRKYHPVREYLESLPEWDGEERVARFFIKYFGASDCEYVRATTEIWFLAAVHRIYSPGCKFDYTPVLTGVGGIGKSKSLAKLGGDWFTDDLCFEDMRDKTAAEKITGKWIVEIGEMKGMRNIDVESVKSFLTRQTDRFRAAYGRHTNDLPRSCVFVGTCNVDAFLRDETGNRRFWPIKCYTEKDLTADLTKDVVKQIWAEVMTTYELEDRDPKLWLSPELEKEAQRQQNKALEVDARAGIIEEYLARKLPEHWYLMSIEDRRMWLENNSEADGMDERTEVCTLEIWCECLGYPERAFGGKESRLIAVILKSLGWISSGKQKRLGPYGKQRVFVRAEDDILQ